MKVVKKLQKTPKTKIVNQVVSVDQSTGEATEIKTTVRYPVEADYVKMYLDFDAEAAAPRISVLQALLRRMSYSDAKDGGNMVAINSDAINGLSKETGLSEGRIHNMMTELIEDRIIRRKRIGFYQVNPYFFGRGDWVSVVKLRDSWPLK